MDNLVYKIFRLKETVEDISTRSTQFSRVALGT